MTRTAYTTSVAHKTTGSKGIASPVGSQHEAKGDANDAGSLLLAILSDGELRRSALGIAVLAALIGYGAVGAGFIPAPITAVADELDTSYDSVYKRLRALARLGYVQLSRVAVERQERLFLRMMWPQTKPVARNHQSKKQG